MDIERAGKEIFEMGDLEWLTDCVQLIIEIHSKHGNDEMLDKKLISVMESYGFS